MAIPLLEIKPKTQNQRVNGFDVTDEDDPIAYRVTAFSSDEEITAVIWAAYRQIFSEHLILESYRQPALESQLRNRAISVREFVRGLGKTEVFWEQIAELNSNYRIVDIVCKRFLGRASYSKNEQIAQSIIIATKGLHGFVDSVVDSEEYRSNFGDEIVPYQRRSMEGRPFNLTNPRYDDYWRNRMLEMEIATRSYYQVRRYQSGDLDKRIIRQAISPAFLNMAQTLLVPQLNSQRDVARATSSNIKVPDSSRDASTVKPTVKPVAVALPYRYLPTTPKS